MKTVVMSMNEFMPWRDQHLPIGGPMRGLLFAGDRMWCCDEALGLEVDGEIVGVATIAPKGEDGCGQSEIVAVYVREEYRRRGYAIALLRSALVRCEERGLAFPIGVDVLSAGLLAGMEKYLGSAEKAKLDIRDRVCWP